MKFKVYFKIFTIFLFFSLFLASISFKGNCLAREESDSFNQVSTAEQTEKEDIGFFIYPDDMVQGEFTLIVLKNVKPGTTIIGRIDNDPLSFFKLTEDRYAALAGADLSEKPGARMVSVEVFDHSGIRTHKLEQIIHIVKGSFARQELKVAQGYVTLSKEDRNRANREAELRRRALSASHPNDWKTRFIMPLNGRFTSPFGAQRLFNGRLKSIHKGVDIASPTGTPVVASNTGKIALTGDFFYAGKCVYIDHGNGLFTAYFHLSDLNVKQGDMVQQGEIIGKVGATGRVTGPHLHWSALLAGKNVSPLKLVEISKLLSTEE